MSDAIQRPEAADLVVGIRHHKRGTVTDAERHARAVFVQLACAAVLASTVLFNPVLALINASVMPVPGSAVAMLQGTIVIAAFAIGVSEPDIAALFLDRGNLVAPDGGDCDRRLPRTAQSKGPGRPFPRARDDRPRHADDRHDADPYRAGDADADPPGRYLGACRPDGVRHDVQGRKLLHQFARLFAGPVLGGRRSVRERGASARPLPARRPGSAPRILAVPGAGIARQLDDRRHHLDRGPVAPAGAACARVHDRVQHRIAGHLRRSPRLGRVPAAGGISAIGASPSRLDQRPSTCPRSWPGC